MGLVCKLFKSPLRKSWWHWCGSQELMQKITEACGCVFPGSASFSSAGARQQQAAQRDEAFLHYHSDKCSPLTLLGFLSQLGFCKTLSCKMYHEQRSPGTLWKRLI
jgi:hypothetical protein